MKRAADIDAAGGSIAVVGLGSPLFAKGFRESTHDTGPLFVDAEGLAYRAVAMGRLRLWNLFNFRMLRNALRARKQGFRQGKVEGDPWQLGGTLVVAPGDRLVYAWRNKNVDDDAPIDDVIAALRGAAAQSR